MFEDFDNLVADKCEILDKKISNLPSPQVPNASMMEDVHASNSADINSPLRKRFIKDGTISYSDALRIPKPLGVGLKTTTVTSPPVLSSPCVSSADARAKINTISLHSTVALKTLNQDSSLQNSFEAKPKVNGSTDFVFDTFSKALEAKRVLDHKLDSFNSEILPLDTSKWSIVGLLYEISVEEALDSIVSHNKEISFKKCSSDHPLKNCLTLENAPDALLQVLEVRLCKRGGKYRVVVNMNQKMSNFINSNKLKVCNVICTIYPVDNYNNNRCFNCHTDGHLSHTCKSEVICAFCAGPHRAGSPECTADYPSCSNCIKANKSDTAHAVYSSKCPFNNC